jgi:hypothetical protein
MDNAVLKEIMVAQVKQLYELGIVDDSFIGLDSAPIAANTKQNNPKSFTKDKFNPEKQPKADPGCALGVHAASNQHNERRYSSTGDTKVMCWWTASLGCRSTN